MLIPEVISPLLHSSYPNRKTLRNQCNEKFLLTMVILDKLMRMIESDHPKQSLLKTYHRAAFQPWEYRSSLQYHNLMQILESRRRGQVVKRVFVSKFSLLQQLTKKGETEVSPLINICCVLIMCRLKNLNHYYYYQHQNHQDYQLENQVQ